MDLDRRIERMRQKVMSEGSLDTEWSDIDSIYEEILCEAAKLNVEGNADCGNRTGLSSTDEVVVEVHDLLKYEGTEFVRQCYRSILQREAEPEGLLSQLYLLRSQSLSRLEIIFAVAESDEGKQTNVRLKGGYCKYRLIKFLRKSCRIPIAGRMIQCVIKLFKINRILYQMMVWNQEQQSQIDELCAVNHHLRQEIEEARENLNERIDGLSKQMTDKINKSNEQILQKLNRIGKERLEIIEENLRNNNILIGKHEEITKDYVDKDRRILQEVLSEVCNLKADRKICYDSELQITTNVESSPKTAKTTKSPYYSIDYFDFENRFRGDREHVKKVQEIYLPYFEGKKHVVDLGCGRGEFVELLCEHHIGVKGVDIYQPYVEFGKMHRLPVEYDEAISYLRKQDSVDGIFLGQVVEHLTIGEIIELCRTAYEKLEEGCYLIMETPNPTSLAIYTEAFYTDPSHNKPVHPKTLKYITEKEGFSDVTVLYTESSRLPYYIPKISHYVNDSLAEFDKAMECVTDLLYGSQDYAVIAKK